MTNHLVSDAREKPRRGAAAAFEVQTMRVVAAAGALYSLAGLMKPADGASASETRAPPAPLHQPPSWHIFADVNAVSGDHRAGSTRRIDGIASAAVCRQRAAASNATIYTWHDAAAARGYARACVLRLDGE